MVMKTFVPAYTTDASILGDYDGASSTPRAIIYNNGNGPGTAVQSDIQESMQDQHANSALNLGYVNTYDQGTASYRTTANIETDINKWYSLYTTLIDGIYFDNTRGLDASHESFYNTLCQYVVNKTNGSGANKTCLGVGSDGSVNPPCLEYYVQIADYIILFETPYKGNSSNFPSTSVNVPSWLVNYSGSKFIGNLLKGTFTPGTSGMQAYVDACKACNIYNVFVTDSTSYTAEPSFWSSEVTYVATK